MEALADLPNVKMERLPIGKLAIHEELPDIVAGTMMPVLNA